QAPPPARKQIARAARFDPRNPVGRYVALHERSGPFAPELEIVGFGQHDAERARQPAVAERGAHAANSSSCSLRGASRERKSARSVSKVGRQSAAVMKGRTLAIEIVSRATSSSRSVR